MEPTLYFHPLASFCHKVLIALYEADIPFRPRIVDPGDAGDAAELAALWPVGKIPILRDEQRGRTVPESTVIIEHLAQHYPGAAPLLPADPQACLDVRLWDRFLDAYVQAPMQKIVGDRLRPEDEHDPRGVADARTLLSTAYEMLERQLSPAGWMVGDRFTLADCAAAPALFYAFIVEPPPARHALLAGFFDRLMERPSVRRTLDEARPYFDRFPFRDAMPARFV